MYKVSYWLYKSISFLKRCAQLLLVSTPIVIKFSLRVMDCWNSEYIYVGINNGLQQINHAFAQFLKVSDDQCKKKL